MNNEEKTFTDNIYSFSSNFFVNLIRRELMRIADSARAATDNIQKLNEILINSLDSPLIFIKKIVITDYKENLLEKYHISYIINEKMSYIINVYIVILEFFFYN